MVVILAELTSVDQLVDRLKKGKRRDAASIIETSMYYSASARFVILKFHTVKKKAEDDDDEIVAGPQKMTLRDPVSSSLEPLLFLLNLGLQLTMVRVATPARSIQCVHPACFDATTWFMVMEGTTTWKCPICDAVLNPNELFVDG
jgi:E3 SUMO-protein ligase PIAS1